MLVTTFAIILKDPLPNMQTLLNRTLLYFNQLYLKIIANRRKNIYKYFLINYKPYSIPFL